ncbi:MAG: hypothetical protein EZS26_001470 [Candidatus Ordinivivax streblomastigis]|uniref:GmrSD restriction endonucleases N-terminal domain-containing protein n=1 Tax=Candidatus Ordinivivax streblomastigis TaxID=2540710 RepID=A0A5M8P1P2_9BACT|nr:MAG: hypothetical protein EZS26_001470 [Candidatus Ordinivivax streblomastigis]
MNNAANNIDAKSKSLKDILFEKHYKVGYFQREYRWLRNHIEDLLIDLERSFNSNWEVGHTQQDVANYNKYYMGPIVLFMDGSEYSIVDGQQRLTSFILLMIYLNKKHSEILNTKNKYDGYVFSEHYGTHSYNMNIPERDNMLDYLHKDTKYNEEILKNESCKTILERYNDIADLFPQSLLSEKIFPLFTNWLTEKLVFIEILTQTSDSAYTIFETMNDRGLNLTQTELLKSFLLSNVKDEIKIKELDGIWKDKISRLNTIDDDQDFFKAWFRAKYAITIRTKDKDSENQDFEKIGTRFSSWTQENTKIKVGSESKLLLDIKDPNSFYFFVKSDLCFFGDLYIKLKTYEMTDNIPEHRLKLLSYKGISQSLSYPLILSPILKIDNEETINQKIELVIKYVDSFGVYRMLLDEPITHSSIRSAIYLKIKDIRNLDIDTLMSKLKAEMDDYKKLYLKEDYTRFDNGSSKYILARLYYNTRTDCEFENIYFQRRKDSFALYQFLNIMDINTDRNGLPKGLKDIVIQRLCSYTILPKNLVAEFDALPLNKRIQKLIQDGYLLGFSSLEPVDTENLRIFFMNREKKLKNLMVNYWKI